MTFPFRLKYFWWLVLTTPICISYYFIVYEVIFFLHQDINEQIWVYLSIPLEGGGP